MTTQSFSLLCFVLAFPLACQNATTEPGGGISAPTESSPQQKGSGSTATVGTTSAPLVVSARDAGIPVVVTASGPLTPTALPRFDAGACEPNEIHCCVQGGAHRGCVGECVDGQCMRNGKPWSMPDPSLVCCGNGAEQTCVTSSGCYVPQGGPH